MWRTSEASPFNVIAKAMTLSIFTETEVRARYRQHTDATGQTVEVEVLRKAFDYSRGQPYLVNALAQWCVEKSSYADFGNPLNDDLKLSPLTDDLPFSDNGHCLHGCTHSPSRTSEA